MCQHHWLELWMVSLNVKIRILSEQTSWARYVPDNKCSIERINISTSTQWKQAASARISSIKQCSGEQQENQQKKQCVLFMCESVSHLRYGRVCVTRSEFIRLLSSWRNFPAKRWQIETFHIRNEVNKCQWLKSTKTKH